MSEDFEITILGDESDKHKKPAQSISDEIIEITDPLNDRYNTFRLISWWDMDIIRNATIMVLGAGALGNEILKNLALMGVGRIFIADFDTIEDSNLSRSILYRESDNGLQKAKTAADAVREINPDVEVHYFHGDVIHELGLGVFRQMDVVMGCLDGREARLAINRACWLVDKPWIDGAIDEMEGLVRVFWPNRGPCYECTLSEEDYKILEKRASCNRLAKNFFVERKIPTTPTISSIIGAIQTQEALKILHKKSVKTGQATYFNGISNESFQIIYSEKKDCMSHYSLPKIIEDKTLSSGSSTLKDILTAGKRLIGEDVWFGIPTFITTGKCPICEKEQVFNKPLFKLTYNDAVCPDCKVPFLLEPYERIDGDEPFISNSLRDVGIPSFHILECYALSDPEKSVGIEITGDLPDYFNYISGSMENLGEYLTRRKDFWKNSQGPSNRLPDKKTQSEKKIVVKVSDVSGSTSREFNLSVQKPMKRILPILINQLGYKATMPIAINTRTNHRYLPDDTFESTGTVDDDKIMLYDKNFLP
ncbi:HesA/MoeB/ThiF family protein [Pelolinea submarina]|uniref:Molybdopterin/thiamine biosynthesis adenylyltransferase n=1 Tax=Pelolinea submarina TaxID=913107 RepID=A0A347ZRU4_9CHLR|nr:ThiF family adenylyltransferase [Pelolinea submarina]REG11424.1 molybdopterin/thiamine biosynthesis adenylyltransferase [Pelolinea submarina]BBB48025.1 molybdopterin-synthase adenylyltransferase [Pelolinea submarina]